ncbi:MAG: ABC transporter permease [Candidatus Solibacter sp.]
MRTLIQDLRFGLRSFWSSPGFTAVAVLTLALGIAFNTTVFGWVNGLLLRPFPGSSKSEQLAVMEVSTEGAPNGANQFSWVDYLDYRANLKSLSGMAVHREEVFTLGSDLNAQPLWGELVSGNYFDVLGVRPASGRTFTSQEDANVPGAFRVAVISDRLWRSRFHGDPAAIGKTLYVNQRELTIVGVAPPEFRGTMPGLVFDIWVPATMAHELGMLSERALRSRGNRTMYAIARLRDGTTRQRASAEALAYSRSLAAAYPKSNTGVTAMVLPVWEFHSAAPGLLLQPLRILMAISVLLLLIVCANVTNLLLARSVARRKEFSIRLALGAGGWRLSRQLLTEAVLLASGAAVAGTLLASWMAEALPALVPKINAPVMLGIQFNARVLLFTVLTCAATALLSGILPALFWFRSDINETLKEGGRSGSQGAQTHRTRNLLVIGEVALATLALIGAGLFVRSFQTARSIDQGFDTRNVLLARFYLSGSGFTAPQIQQFSQRLQDRLRAIPGVEAASYADYAPLGSNSGPYDQIEVEGYMPARTESMNVNRTQVSPGYFPLMRIPLLQGRDFRLDDALPGDPAKAPPIVVNQAFVHQYFGAGVALGRRVKSGRDWYTVIAVARDSKYFDVAEAPRPHFFLPFQGNTGQQLYFFIRAAGQPAALAAGLRREVVAVEPRASSFDLMAFAEWTGVTLLPQKAAASLTAGLGLISLLIAGLGLYSVMAYAVTQRTQEIGIRMALGAQPRDVLGDILRRGLALTAIGLALGLFASLVVTRLIAGMLVRISATDPLTFLGGAAFLLLVSALASYIPARRATKVDPVIALRCD